MLTLDLVRWLADRQGVEANLTSGEIEATKTEARRRCSVTVASDDEEDGETVAERAKARAKKQQKPAGDGAAAGTSGSGEIAGSLCVGSETPSRASRNSSFMCTGRPWIGLG